MIIHIITSWSCAVSSSVGVGYLVRVEVNK